MRLNTHIGKHLQGSNPVAYPRGTAYTDNDSLCHTITPCFRALTLALRNTIFTLPGRGARFTLARLGAFTIGPLLRLTSFRFRRSGFFTFRLVLLGAPAITFRFATIAPVITTKIILFHWGLSARFGRRVTKLLHQHRCNIQWINFQLTR